MDTELQPVGALKYILPVPPLIGDEASLAHIPAKHGLTNTQTTTSSAGRIFPNTFPRPEMENLFNIDFSPFLYAIKCSKHGLTAKYPQNLFFYCQKSKRKKVIFTKKSRPIGATF
jgi:hypothetical protein